MLDFTALGDPVNTASRLAESAGAGEIVLSEDVYSALDGKHPAAERRTLSLRGKEAPFGVYVLRSQHP